MGITGSIGMGKTTVGSMLETLGVAVHDSDVAVHDSLRPGAQGYLGVAKAFPYFEYADIYGDKNADGYRVLDRTALGKIVFSDESKRTVLESILHPLVRSSQQDFILAQKGLGRDAVALDIPLLFETGGEDRVDYTLVVSAPYHLQRQRVLARDNMSEEKFEAILAAQMPDAEKCARADYVISTGLGKAETLKALKKTLSEIRGRT